MTDLTLRSLPKPLEQYIISDFEKMFKKYPLLPEEEEKSLIHKTYYKNDKNAFEKLVLSNMHAVLKVVKGYSRYGLAVSDLIQEGCVGLIKAVKSYTPGYKNGLLIHAYYFIKKEIHEFVLTNWSTVMKHSLITKEKFVRRLNDLRKSVNYLLANDVKTDHTLNRVNSAKTLSFRPSTRYSNVKPFIKMILRKIPKTQFSSTEIKEIVNDIDIEDLLICLDINEREIIEKRWLSPLGMTYKMIAMQYQNRQVSDIVSIETKALKKLQKHIKLLLSTRNL